MCASTPNTAPENRALHVAVAAIINAQDQVLLSLRPDHVHQGGLWEFPGGKLEAGESVGQALAREIHEELGIHIGASYPLIRIHHHYPDREVLLDVRRIDTFDGEVRGCEGQTVEWVSIRQLGERAFPAANRPIIQALQLPPAYLITPAPGPQPAHFLQQLQTALEGGIRLVQLRAPGLSPQAYAQLAHQVVPLCHRYQAQVLLNAEPELVEQTGADGLHLNSQRLTQSGEGSLSAAKDAVSLKTRDPGIRRDDGKGINQRFHKILMASCHNPAQLQQARQIGVDAAVLSPVQATASHPEAEPLGWARFAEWVDPCPFPVYALGGMQATDIATAQAHGGQGVAAIRALWPGG